MFWNQKISLVPRKKKNAYKQQNSPSIHSFLILLQHWKFLSEIFIFFGKERFVILICLKACTYKSNNISIAVFEIRKGFESFLKIFFSLRSPPLHLMDVKLNFLKNMRKKVQNLLWIHTVFEKNLFLQLFTSNCKFSSKDALPLANQLVLPCRIKNSDRYSYINESKRLANRSVRKSF